MCYDISFETTIPLVRDYFPDLIMDGSLRLDFSPRAHIQAQAYLPHPVIIMENGKHVMKLFEWGIIPEYMKTPLEILRGRNGMCNAQSEKILGDKRSYWHRIRKNRCLIPVTGIYEHRKVEGFKNKIPYLVKVKEERMFFIPGLYHYSKVDTETGELIGTYTLVTRAANSLMREIHNDSERGFRMPLFVPFDLAKRWLEDTSDEAIKDVISFEMPSEKLEHYPVYTIRGKNASAEEDRAKRYDWEKLPEIIV